MRMFQSFQGIYSECLLTKLWSRVADYSNLTHCSATVGKKGPYGNCLCMKFSEIFKRLVHDVPDEWLSQEKKGGLDAVWGSPGFHARLASLRSKLKNGTLV